MASLARAGPALALFMPRPKVSCDLSTIEVSTPQMINRVTGEIDFRSGLHIRPHCSIQSLAGLESAMPIKTQKLTLKEWQQHVLGSHLSEHGTFEVEALSVTDDCVRVVLLCHRHEFYEPGTPEDAERRAWLSYNDPIWIAQRHSLGSRSSSAVTAMADLLRQIVHGVTGT